MNSCFNMCGESSKLYETQKKNRHAFGKQPSHFWCNAHPSPLVKVDVAILQRKGARRSLKSLWSKKKKRSSRQHAEVVSSFPPWPGGATTHIQPVFDCRVQHGEVCEEDPQVGHRALGARLCGKKDNTHNLQKRVKVPRDFFFLFMVHKMEKATKKADFRATACS